MSDLKSQMYSLQAQSRIFCTRHAVRKQEMASGKASSNSASVCQPSLPILQLRKTMQAPLRSDYKILNRVVNMDFDIIEF